MMRALSEEAEQRFKGTRKEDSLTLGQLNRKWALEGGQEFTR